MSATPAAYRDLEESPGPRRAHSRADCGRDLGGALLNESIARLQIRRGRYGIFEVGLLASVASVKPKISKQRLRNASPTKNAAKGKRSVYASGAWVDATIWEMERLQPGNVIAGPAIIEQSATTLVVPSSRSVRVDEYGFFRLD
jgi:N-methylhydantoinase A/oxoprolinase/acetone carboxylase beta subunit